MLILVEGQTEETFARTVLNPHLSRMGVYPKTTLATTKRVKKGSSFRGGIVSYTKVRKDLVRLLGDTSAAIVTTMIDFYALPTGFPEYTELPRASCYERVAHLERAFKADIDHPRFVPYVALHEFEAMLFANTERISHEFPDKNISEDLRAVRRRFQSPEEIDEEQPPSKWLKALIPEYQKVLHGSLISQEIGLEQIRHACPHFNEWLTQLEKLGSPR